MLDDDPASDRSLELMLAALLGLIGVLAAFDIAIDLDARSSVAHVLGEGLVALSALIAAALLLLRLIARRRQLSRRLADTEAAAARWRAQSQSVLMGLGASINAQFVEWTLSVAEKETALLLLKGLSHKEIAQARGISDATARQQAGAVYRKAGVSGRSELAAFFLEDLALPDTGPAPQKSQ